ncbi:hypothetical protein BYT27DRAFT_7226963 [Phlegmacium glaucopus]|nr:hypothetical protein BYT27DRAFT_7226963 [Phlegmacium glaucopus]
MHFATVFTLAAAVVSTSASLVARQSLPDCAASCLLNANLNGCIVSDTHCLCTNQVFVSSTTQCIETSCSGSDLQNALSYSQALCAAVGVTLSNTAAASTSTTASAATTVSAATTASSGSASSGSASSGSASATPSKAAAAAHGANTFVGLAAVGLVALAL